MKRLGLVLILIPAFACDMPDKSIGDSGSAGDSNGEGGESSESGSEGGGEEGACTLIGCDDGLFATLRHDGLPDGNYQIQLIDADTDTLAFGCDFGVVNGQVEDADCLVSQRPGALDVILPLGVDNAQIDVLLDGTLVASHTEAPDYQQLYPNGEECGPVCTQGSVTFDL